MSVPIVALEKKEITVLGKKMAYVEAGTGDPILFLHGNPTSSFLWRNIIPQVSNLGRCIAPDLIGMGDSEKLENPDGQTYTFDTHRKYLDSFIDSMGLSQKVTLVIHDWGSALGFDWAYRNQKAVKAILYMEAILYHYTWDEWPEGARRIFQTMRSEAGESIVLEKNVFVEKILPASILRRLTDEEMDQYRKPFKIAGSDRLPTLTWPRQIPIEGEPKEMVEIVEAFGKWLQGSDIPKLFINAEPGIVLTGKAREFCRTWQNQQEVTVQGLHFIQEDSPQEIGSAISEFINNLS